MKVTICFGSFRVVVPVGDGNITVAELATKSLERYRRITRKDPAQKVTIQHLYTITDSGILYPDDILSDVVDDKDVLVAVYEEENDLDYSAHHSPSDNNKNNNNITDTHPRITTQLQPLKTSTPFQEIGVAHGIEVDQKDGRISGVDDRTFNFSERERPKTGLLKQPTKFDIEIDRKNQPLGIEIQHILQCGLYVVGLEHAARLDNRLKVGDKVISINDVDLSVIPDISVFEVFMEMTQTAVVRLSVVRSDEYFELLKNAEPVTPVQHQEKAITARNETSPDEKNEITESPQELMEITLQKGERGLGFTIATREYKSTVGSNPIFIKTVHRYGAAGTHGIMKPNDILLKVNGVSLEGMTQSEVVGMMRQLQGSVSLTLKRPSHNSTAREKQIEVSKTSPEEKATETSPPKQTTTHTYVKKQIKLDIPLITPEGKGIGLGISVKGKNTGKPGEPRQAYGLFVKNILKDGAAYLDGRLKPNDQLISAGGDSLLGRPNKDAMLVFKNSLERSANLNSVSLIIIRKELSSSQTRAAKVTPKEGSLASDPSRYRNLSVSSPNLGNKRKNKPEVDGGGRCVVFDEKIESIPSTEEVLESDEDVVFVGDLVDDGTDPFIRESIFRKSMKKIYHTPFDPKRLNIKRASSHDSLAQHSDNTPTMPLLKRGLSSESIFSGKSGEPIYSTIKPTTLSKDAEKSDNGKTKQKGFLNFFSKKTNKKKDEVGEPDKTLSSEPELDSFGRRSDRSSKERNGPRDVSDHQRTRNRSNEKSQDRSYERQKDRSHERQRDRSHERPRNKPHERPRDAKPQSEEYSQKRHQHVPPQNNKLSELDHKRSKSSEYYRDWEIAESSGLGYIEHGPIRNDYDRRSNHSTHSSRSRTNKDAVNHRGYPNSNLRDDRYLDSIASNTHNKFRYGRSSPASLADLDRTMSSQSAPFNVGYYGNGNLRNDAPKGHRYYSNTLDHRGRMPHPNLPPPISHFAEYHTGTVETGTQNARYHDNRRASDNTRYHDNKRASDNTRRNNYDIELNMQQLSLTDLTPTKTNSSRPKNKQKKIRSSPNVRKTVGSLPKNYDFNSSRARSLSRNSQIAATVSSVDPEFLKETNSRTSTPSEYRPSYNFRPTHLFGPGPSTSLTNTQTRDFNGPKSAPVSDYGKPPTFTFDFDK